MAVLFISVGQMLYLTPILDNADQLLALFKVSKLKFQNKSHGATIPAWRSRVSYACLHDYVA